MIVSENARATIMDFFKGKIILAPMVRANTIAFRLLCIKYCADAVFSQEIVDHSILSCKRIENEKLNSIDFVNDSYEIIFRTIKSEKPKLIFQLVASDNLKFYPGNLKENDISALDINMGCPKSFSISGGMGAALLSKKEKAKKILTNLVKNSSIPITCKIRLLPGDIDNTIDFIRYIIPSGVCAISIHGRNRNQSSSESCNIDYLKKICEIFKNDIPIIVNGGSLHINSYNDIIYFRDSCGATSVLVARAALRNPSVFSFKGLVPILDIFREYASLCIQWDVEFFLFKYMLSRMCIQSDEILKLSRSDSYEDTCIYLGIEYNYNSTNIVPDLLFNWNCFSNILDVKQQKILERKKGIFKSQLHEMMRYIHHWLKDNNSFASDIEYYRVDMLVGSDKWKAEILGDMVEVVDQHIQVEEVDMDMGHMFRDSKDKDSSPDMHSNVLYVLLITGRSVEPFNILELSPGVHDPPSAEELNHRLNKIYG
ncbi:hypothetical protein HZS_6467, partial [Henneguya salminicola]